jgi:O-antigen ligase
VIADNMYLSILVEAGLPGLSALLLLNTAILIACYRQARSPDLLKRLCGTWMFAFWCGEIVQMATGDVLTYWRLLPSFFIVLAIAARNDNSLPRPV